MRLLRGRTATPAADRERTAAMLNATGETGEAAFRAWTPHRHVAFGRRDARSDGYETARRRADERGFPTVERDVGGRAVVSDGGVVAFAHAVPDETPRAHVGRRYDEATATVRDALAAVGATVTPGEPPDSFCPGDHSLRVPDGGKVVGLAQRVRVDAALVAGCVVVRRGDLPAVYADVYDALGVPFDPASVGSVADAGGPTDPDDVVAALEGAFAPRPTAVEAV